MNSETYLIKNAVIINGRNEPTFPGALLIEDGRIAKILKTPDPGASARLGNGMDGKGLKIPDAGSFREFPESLPVLDACGAYVTPGFVDIHRHGDWMALKGARGGDDELLNRQGITTVVNGNCGLSVMPAEGAHHEEIGHFLQPVTGKKPPVPEAEKADRDLRSYFEALAKIPRTVNTGMLAGNGTIRACAAGYHPGALSRDEVRAVRRSVENAISDGALGISLGLGYAPEFEYDAEGLIEVLEPLRGTDIPITTHIRNEGDGSFESIEEVIRVAEALKIPLHISHMKCIGRRNWRSGPVRTLALLHRKRAEGLKADYDLYPYKTGSTQLFHVIPPAFQAGGTERFLENLKDPEFRKAMTRALKTPSHDFENIVELVGLDHVVACSMISERYRDYSGHSVEAIAEILGEDPYETLYRILEAEKCEVTMLDTIACEEDIRDYYRDPLSSVISDAIYPEGGRLHPRVYAAFPYFLIRYVRESRLLSIEEAVHKMTAGPAAVLKIDRGVIEEGAAADLCVFDLDELRAAASFEKPDQMCEGFRYVIAGGRIVVRDDVWQAGAAGVGKMIRRGM